MNMTRFVLFITALLMLDGILVREAQASCTRSSLLDSGQKCVSQFYKESRRNPKRNCSAIYNKLRGCIHKGATQCIKTGPEPRKAFSTGSVWQLARAFTVSEDWYCVKGMFDTSSYVTVDNFSDCNKRLFKSVKKCDRRFNQLFQRNRSSPALCRKYRRFQRCVRKYITKFCPHDSPEAESVRWIYKENFNPHCERISLDPRRKRKGVSSNQTKMVGRCAVKRFYIDSRKCIAKFYQALQKDLRTSCGKIFDGEFIPCLRALYKNCSVEMEPEDTVKRRKNSYCNMGVLSPLNLKFCKSAYFGELSACSAVFRRKFNMSRGDMSLCSEYSKVKHCSKNVTLANCQSNKQRSDVVDYYYNKFNPFCANSLDPTPGENRDLEVGKQAKPTEKAVSTSARIIGSDITLLITEVTVLGLFLIK